MLTIHHIYALLVLTGRFSPHEAQAGAAMLEDGASDDPSTVREAVMQLVGAITAATRKLRVNCPRCDGRGFYRGHKLAENEAIVVYCDDCEGHGTVLTEVDQ